MGGQSYKRLFTDHLCPEICIVCISVKPLSEKLLTKLYEIVSKFDYYYHCKYYYYYYHHYWNDFIQIYFKGLCGTFC